MDRKVGFVQAGGSWLNDTGTGRTELPETEMPTSRNYLPINVASIALVAIHLAACGPRASAAPHMAPLGRVVATPLGARLDTVFRRFEAYGFSGVIAVGDSGGLHILSAYGSRDLERGLPTRANTLYDIASTDKTFIAALMLDLARRGEIRLDDPLDRFFPVMRPPQARITVRELLSHSSGLSRDWQQRRDGALDTRDKTVAVVQSIPLDSGAKRFSYSNLGYDMLKAVAEAATGREYSDLLHERVLAPVGARFVFSPFGRPSAAAVGYRGPVGTPLAVLPRAAGAAGETYAGATPFATVPDLYAWFAALHARRILPDSLLAMMTSAQSGDYGFGWFVYPGQLNVGGGDTEGYQTSILFHRPSGLVVVAATNMRSDDRRAWWRGAITKAVQLIRLRREYTLPPEPASNASFAAFAGTYRFASGASLVFAARDGALVATPQGQAALDALTYPDGNPPAAIGRVVDAADRTAAAMIRGDTAAVRAMLRNSAGDDGLQRFNAIWQQAAAGTGAIRSHRVLGVVATSGQTWQSYVELTGSTRADTLRMLWNPQTIRLEGWGLGGGDPVSLRFLVVPNGGLAAYLPAEDLTIRLDVVRDSSGTVTAVRTAAGAMATRSRP